jgi:hypothetical protein
MRTKALIAIMLLAVTPAVAGTTFEMTSKDSTGEKVDHIRMIIEGNKLRMDVEMTAEGEYRTTAIFRGDREEMMILDHAKAEAAVLDRATMEKVAGYIQEARKQIEQALANAPPEQREMMEQMMKGRMEGVLEAPPPTEVVKTSETGTTGNYPWVKYEVNQEGAKIREYLVTDWSTLKIDGSTFEVFKEMAKFLEGFTKGTDMNFGATAHVPYEEINSLDGFPVVTREFDDGAAGRETHLDSVTTGDVDGGLFENPNAIMRFTEGV